MAMRNRGLSPSFMGGGRMSYQENGGQKKKKEEEQETVGESMGRLGRFFYGKKTEEEKKDPIKHIQEFAAREAERQKKKKKEEEERKRKGVEPQKGFMRRMIDKYIYGKEDEG